MAYVLSDEKRLRALAALVDGNSERAVSRITGVNRQTVGRLALRLGDGCQRLHNRLVRGLSCSIVEVDEQWSYVKKKQARVTPEDGSDVGEAWSWIGLDQASRLVVSFWVGKREDADAKAFIADLRSRLVVMPKLLTSDGLAAYVEPILTSFGPAVPYGQVIKRYRRGASVGPDYRYEPPREPFLTKKAVFGAPDMKGATTAHVERQNGTNRHKNGRMRRLCYAFSKKLPNHQAAAAIGYTHYNFCHIISTTRLTPAMAAGVTDHLWDLDEFLAAVLDAEPCDPPAKAPLTIPVPATTARELPNGRGFLRVVPGSGTPSPSPTPPAPEEPPSTPDAPAPAPTDPEDDAAWQLDPFSWAPMRREPKQLSLFDE